MAITLKSQGSGVSTETSGAALSPLCPAVVDAGDILIAHVFWESNVTAPSTPANWTLLSGPNLIQTNVARHWVFGKIADGTEDGAAIAFGNPAVTTQRGARIYSFAGRVNGTVANLVNGFAHLSHATDPAMPTVTTTKAGSLAVALVAQNDNNPLISPTGETGGDWVEAIAEYTVALTPGFSLGICTCTPTANPGTVTGGTTATTDDPCGVIGFQIRDDARIYVTPGIASGTNTALARALSKNVPVGRADGTNTALTRTLSKRMNTGRADGTNTGLALTLRKFLSVNRSNEIDTAPNLSLSFPRTIPVGRADETGIALARTLLKVLVINRADSTDTALTQGIKKVIGISRSEEIDESLDLSFQTGTVLGLLIGPAITIGR